MEKLNEHIDNIKLHMILQTKKPIKSYEKYTSDRSPEQ